MLRNQQTGAMPVSDEVSRFALRALSSVMPSQKQGGHVPKPLESYLSQLHAALLAPDFDVLENIVSAMRRAHITDQTIVEIYVPILARRLGDGWAADTLNFTSVTLGTARLQNLVRRLETTWEMPDGTIGSIRSACLVGVPRGVQHTLGATILVAALRKRGVFVNLCMDLGCDTLIEEMQKQSFAAVMLSASGKEHLDVMRDLVACAHGQQRSTPVILGGRILEDTDNAASYVKADFATCDVGDAMTFAGMATIEMTPSQVATSNKVFIR
jgi:methanogenic corrinoid protein MtbC1